MKKYLKYLLPYRVKNLLKRAYYSAADIFDFVTGRKDKKYPPRRLNFVGSSEFKKVGKDFLAYFKDLGGLKSYHRVLDIGCGVGRIAIPLTGYLHSPGRYFGFDIVKKGIEWGKKNITPKNPHFEFIHADIKNQFYNPKGSLQSQEFLFPGQDQSYDFCLATSVFTHMLPDEINHYLAESARILKPGGKLFATFFLLPKGDHKEYLTEWIKFRYKYQKLAYYSHKNCIEAEVGYSVEWVKKMLGRHHFSNIKIYPGQWRDAKKGVSYQDMVVAERMINN
jgi:SAM-dependent methyltransferase